jgi:transposase
MLTFDGDLKVYVALDPWDMRKSFHGLAAMARETPKADPLFASAFLFANRRHNPHQKSATCTAAGCG